MRVRAAGLGCEGEVRAAGLGCEGEGSRARM